MIAALTLAAALLGPVDTDCQASFAQTVTSMEHVAQVESVGLTKVQTLNVANNARALFGFDAKYDWGAVLLLDGGSDGSFVVLVKGADCVVDMRAASMDALPYVLSDHGHGV